MSAYIYGQFMKGTNHMKCIRMGDIYHIIKSSENKKVIIYGSGSNAADIIKKLECLNIDVAYCVENDFSNIKVEKQVLDIYSLILEKDDFYVFIAKDDVQLCAKMLSGLGLECLKDYNRFFCASGNMGLENTFSLDPILGYSLPYEECNGKGVKIYGNIATSDCVVAILGGSNSASAVYTWKSWGEFFYEKALAENKNIAVIVGAVNGYSSSEELFKLIRDILPLNPDIVISYSGVNDRKAAYTYINSYQMRLYNKLALCNQADMYRVGNANKVCCGVAEQISPAKRWIKNQRMMYSITKEFGIQFFSFFQPTMISKKKGEKDEEIYFYINESEIINKEHYIREIKEILTQNNMKYIVDATVWFDNMDGYFYDHCHVYEDGNQYIADKIYEYVFGGSK